jgi:arylsulfatase A-like enzyme
LHSFGNLSENTATIRRDPRKHYFAALEALDSELGRLLNSLSPAVRRDTIVIFTGDNGSPRQITRRLNTQREAKGTIYNGGTQVPMVVAGPGISKGRIEQPVQVTDLHDTILALTGTGGQTDDSHDLTPSFTGNPTSREAVYIEHFSSKEGRGRPVYGWAMISKDYSLIAPENASMELYQSSDEKQRKDVIDAAQSQAKSLVALRDAFLD